MTRAEPRVAVVIPCRGHAEELALCLASLRDQRPHVEHETIVVDAGGDDAVARCVRGFPEVQLVRSPGPLGPGAARNLGVRHSRAPLLAFLDADCAAEPGWLAAILEGLEGRPGVAGGPIRDLLPLHPIAAADNYLVFYEQSTRRAAGAAGKFPGCNLAIDRASFEALGGFPDERIAEDTLFTEAAERRSPGSLRFVPAMRVRHRGRTEIGAFLRHHRDFGRARGRLGLLSLALDRRLSHLALWSLPLACKRLAFMALFTARNRPLQLLRLAPLSPLVVLGVGAWALGVVEGSRDRRRAAISAPDQAGAALPQPPGAPR